MYKSLPTLTELRPQSIAAQLFTDSSYSELGTALKERIKTAISVHIKRKLVLIEKWST